jgi:hypothetical protein
MHAVPKKLHRMILIVFATWIAEGGMEAFLAGNLTVRKKLTAIFAHPASAIARRYFASKNFSTSASAVVIR